LHVDTDSIVLEEYGYDDTIRWTGELSPCKIQNISVDGRSVGRKYGKKFNIEGGEVKGMITLSEINDITDGSYYSIDDVPEVVAKDCINDKLGYTFSLYINDIKPSDVGYNRFMTNEYQNVIEEIEFGDENSEETNENGIYYARIYSPDIASTLAFKLFWKI